MSTNTWTVGRSILFTGVALAAALLVDQMVGCMSAAAQWRPSVASVGQSSIPATADELIQQMSLSAAIIFAGEVVTVRHPGGFSGSPEDASEGVVEIDFRVDQPVLGVQGKSIYTLREWSGLWTGGTERYHAGQRLLMLLRAPNPAGLTAPVHGSEGAIPLRGIGAAPGPYDSTSAAAEWMVDIRWLQAQTRKQQLRAPAPVRGPLPIRGGRLNSEAVTSEAEANATPSLVHALPGPWIEQADAVAQVESLSHVLGLCVASAEPQDAR